MLQRHSPCYTSALALDLLTYIFSLNRSTGVRSERLRQIEFIQDIGRVVAVVRRRAHQARKEQTVLYPAEALPRPWHPQRPGI